MRNLLSRATAVAVLGMFANPSQADAAVVWNWSSSTTEAGTFTTNGTLADVGGPFSFEITDFSVTASSNSDLLGKPYTVNQPEQGFGWDGTSATMFYRSSGLYTNGSSFGVPDANSDVYRYVFYVDNGSTKGWLEDQNENVLSSYSLTLNPVSPVPEPGTNLAMLALGAGGLTLRRRLKAKSA